MLGINDLKKTVPGGINPRLALNEQAEHLDFAESYEITRKRIRLGKAVGTGNFGVVHVARAKRILPNEAESIVAVKMLTETFGREVKEHFNTILLTTSIFKEFYCVWTLGCFENFRMLFSTIFGLEF